MHHAASVRCYQYNVIKLTTTTCIMQLANIRYYIKHSNLVIMPEVSQLSLFAKMYAKLISLNIVKEMKMITRILKSPRFCEFCVWCNRLSFTNCDVFDKRHLWHFHNWLLVLKVRTYCSLEVPGQNLIEHC